MPSRIEAVSYTDKATLSAANTLEDAVRRWHLVDAPAIRPTSTDHRAALILQLAEDLLYERIADPEHIRHQFARRFGSGPIGSVSTQQVDLSQAADGVVRVTLTLTSVHDWDRLQRAGLFKEDRFVHVRSFFRDRAGRRMKFRKPETTIRAVAVHYLSRDGGGELTLTGAAEFYGARFEDDEWDASTHARVISEVEREYGPLP